MKKIYAIYSLILVFFICQNPVYAQIASGNGFLKGNYVEAGIRPNGAFGSTVAAPSDYFSKNASKYVGRIGFIADVGKNGWTVGSPAYIGDFFLPGSPYEAFSVKMNGTLYENSGGGNAAINGSVTDFISDGTSSSVEWTGLIGNLEVRQVATVGKDKSYILIRVFFKNKGSATISNVFYTRSVDPDNEVDQGGSYSTINTIEQQNMNSTSTALVSGKGINYGSYLGLGSRDCRARVAVMSSFSSNGEDIYNGIGSVALKNAGATNTADNAIAVAFNVGNLAAGETSSVAMAYVLNASDLPPAMAETDPLFKVSADTYVSGSQVDFCSGSEAIIEIQNGDGFTWSWSPATGLDKTTGKTVKATLNERRTYTASGVNSCGTIRTINVTINPVILPPPAAAGSITASSSSISSGQNVTFSVADIPNATYYEWGLPPGATYVSGYRTKSITVSFGGAATSGALTVAGANSCGVGAESSKGIIINGVPAITGVRPINSANISNNSRPVITGSAAPNATVTVFDGATSLGTTTAGSDGQWSFTPATALSAAAHTITAKVGTSSASNAITFTIDATAPAKPATPALNTGKQATSNPLPTLIGTAEANAIVTILDGTTTIGTVRAGADGRWTFTPTSTTALTEATHSITVKATDAADNVSVASDVFMLVVDFTAPAAPAVPVLAGGNEGNINTTTPTITGTAEANSTVTIYVGDVAVGTTTAAADGSWTYTFSPALADGPHTVAVSATDASGNVGGKSPALAINVDTQQPATPTVPVLAGGNSGNISNNTPTISGMAEANSTVTIYVGGVAVGTTKAAADGSWTYIFNPALSDAAYTVAITSKDVSGNESEKSAALNITVDTQKPATPAVPVLAGGNNGNTNDATPTITGTAEANSTVIIYVYDIEVGTSTVAADGTWTYTFITAPRDGEYVITVASKDASGNVSETSTALNITVDTQKPAMPAVPVLAGGNNGNTNDTTPTITGMAEANSTVTIYIGGTAVGTTTAAADGSWTYTFSPALNDNAYTITVVAKDASGNESETSAALTINVDTQQPAAPAVPVLAGGNEGNINTTTPTITGTAEANSTVTIYVGDVAVGTTTAAADGSWTYTFDKPLREGITTIEVMEEDAAGNRSDMGVALNIQVDIKVPTGYTVEFNQEKIDFTNQTNVSIKVTGVEVGTTYYYTIASSAKGSTPVTGTGTAASTDFEIPALDVSSLTDGTLTITFYQQDLAGNKGEEVAAQIVKLTRNIIVVTSPAKLIVPIRTTYTQLSLPTTVEVTYSDNTKQSIPVTWSAGNYNGDVAGNYELAGTLTLAPGTNNLQNLSALLVVEVQPNKVPTALALSKNTFSPNIAPTEAIGAFATTDADDTEHVYTLVKGQGDANNNWFEIRGNALYLKSNEGLSGKTQFSIRVSTTDVYNNTFEQTFTLTKGEYAKAVADLKIVNTFTPNNDGINDDWTIPELKFYNQVEIEVFDRSGVRLFYTTDPEKGWDGKDQNGLVRKGSYLYVVQVKDINLVKKGVVSILKK